MSIALVQQATSSSSSSIVVKLSSNTVAGNFLVACFCEPSGTTIASVTDTTSNRWIQIANSNSTGGAAEIWAARAIQGGACSVTAVVNVANDAYASSDFYNSLGSYDGGGGSVGANVSEWSGVWGVSPLDQWSQNTTDFIGNSGSVFPQTVVPRTTGDLVISVGSSSASVSGPFGGFTALQMSGATASVGYAAAYYVASGASVPGVYWNASSVCSFACAEAAFLLGPNSGAMTLWQFPELLVELSTQGNYQAPLNGMGIWTNTTMHVRQVSIGPTGRAHLLDRCQASPIQITYNNRGDNTLYSANGAYNPWNTASFLYNGGNGLKPQNPVKITAAWLGVSYALGWAYLQSLTPVIGDALNSDMQLDAIDILQILSLAYLDSPAYANFILGGG